MIRILLFLFVFTGTALAETWSLIGDSDDPQLGRLVVDISSVDLTEYVKNQNTQDTSIAIFARMQYVGINQQSRVFVASIDAYDCVRTQEGKIVNIFDDNTLQTYFWSATGSRMYDAQGGWLCGFLIGTLQKQSASPYSKDDWHW